MRKIATNIIISLLLVSLFINNISISFEANPVDENFPTVLKFNDIINPDVNLKDHNESNEERLTNLKNFDQEGYYQFFTVNHGQVGSDEVKY